MAEPSPSAGATLGPEGPPPERRQKALVWFVGILLTILAAWALRQTAAISMPLVAAFFIAVGVWPVVGWSRTRLPRRLRWLAYGLAMGLVLLALGLFFGGIWFSASQIAGHWSDYDQVFSGWWEDAHRLLERVNGDNGGDAGAAAAGASPLSWVSDIAFRVVGSVGRMLALLVLVFFLVLLMLVETTTWQEKIRDSARDDRASRWIELVADVARRFRRYVLVRVAVGFVSGLLYYVWLLAWGIDFALVFGLLAFLLNFVPTLGSLVSGVLPALFAFVQLDPGSAVIVALGVLAIEQVMGNYVDPRLQGRQLAISPLMVLVSLMVWGWIWGVAGALLAVPLTVLLAMVFVRIPALEPLALALSDVRSRDELRRAMAAE